MSTLKDVLSNIDNQNQYQETILKNLECEKEYLEKNVSCIIQDIIKCFEQRYGDLIDEADKYASNTVKETIGRLFQERCAITRAKVFRCVVNHMWK